MKIKRKLVPNSNDKEFVLMSVNDLKNLVYDSLGTFGDPESVNTLINNLLHNSGLKTPVSHQKRQKKEKSKENVNVNE